MRSDTEADDTDEMCFSRGAECHRKGDEQQEMKKEKKLNLSFLNIVLVNFLHNILLRKKNSKISCCL